MIMENKERSFSGSVLVCILWFPLMMTAGAIFCVWLFMDESVSDIGVFPFLGFYLFIVVTSLFLWAGERVAKRNKERQTEKTDE